MGKEGEMGEVLHSHFCVCGVIEETRWNTMRQSVCMSE